MVRYNWELIKKYTNNDIEKILKYFSNIYILKGEEKIFTLKYKWAAKIYNESKDTNSFLINIEDLVENAVRATSIEQFIYLDLASKRDIFTYLNTRHKVSFLPYWKVEGLYDIEKLKTNRLLIIEDNNINFVYEGD